VGNYYDGVRWGWARDIVANSEAIDQFEAPHAAPEPCQLLTDGFAAYPEAVELAFGPYVKYGTIIKEYKNANMT
jgi:hypothetical protein